MTLPSADELDPESARLLLQLDQGRFVLAGVLLRSAEVGESGVHQIDVVLNLRFITPEAPWVPTYLGSEIEFSVGEGTGTPDTETEVRTLGRLLTAVDEDRHETALHKLLRGEEPCRPRPEYGNIDLPHRSTSRNVLRSFIRISGATRSGTGSSSETTQADHSPASFAPTTSMG